MNKSHSIALIKLLSAMTIFGTIGVFVRYISLPSSVIALARGMIGVLFLLVSMWIRKHKISMDAFKQNMKYLLLSGICIGFNWIFLFEAYRYTSVAVSTLCYYMAPVFVILVSPVALKESLTTKKILCVLTALIGMVFISGILNTAKLKITELKGVIFGLLAAALYASVMIFNKKITQINAYDKTVFQLSISALTLIPYCFITVDSSQLTFNTTSLLALIFVGIVHTGFTYFLYFGAMDHLKGQTVAVLSYLDPVVAVIISALILREGMDIFMLIGSLLIIGSAICLEFPSKRKINL